jgi:tetratricopeptide (TPR) repeat protein
MRLGNLPLADEERGPLREEVYGFLLLLTQLKSQASGGDPAAARETRALLDRARSIQEPSRGYYRLSAACARLLREDERAAADQRRADDPATRTTALDHFLRGEEERTRAIGPEAQGPALQRALEEYALAVRDEPRAYWAHFQMGRCYLGLGRENEALEALAVCTAVRPEAPWAPSVRGLALASQRRFPEALRELQRVVERHPDFAPARLNLGAVYWLQRQYEPALEQFDQVLQLGPEKRLVEAAYYRGVVRLERGDEARRDVENAVEDLSRTIRERPQLRAAYLARAQAHLAHGEDGPALDDLNAALRTGQPRFDPEGPAGYEERGRLLRGLIPRLPRAARGKAVAAALREFRKAEELGGRSAALFDDLGAILELSGRPEEALRAYSRGLELAPDHARLRNKRGWVLLGVKPPQSDQARGDFAVASRLKPATAADRLAVADAHIGLGYVHACAGRAPDAAHEATRTLLALRGTEGDAVRHVDHYVLRHNLACIYGELSRSDAKHRAEHEELAMEFLREAVAQARRTGAGAEEADNIDGEPAFPPSLRERPDFRELQKSARR